MGRRGVIALACATALLVACGDDGGGADGGGGDDEIANGDDSPGAADGTTIDDDERDRIATLLEAQDLSQAAEDVRASDTEVATLDTPYLDGWAIHRFDRFADRDVQHVVAASDDEAVLLRAAPEVFVAVLEADDVVVDDADTAVAVTRDYLFATRPTDLRSYLVEDVDDLELRSDVSDQDREGLRAELDDVLAPPQVEEDGDTLTVTAFVLYADQIERREVTFVDGLLQDDDVAVVAEGLPVPPSL